MTPATRSPARRHGQRGNAVVLALLALAVTGLAAATALQSRRVELKRDAGTAEAGTLERLRNGVQSAVYEHLADIQQGQPLVKGGTAVTPALVDGELVWSPTVQQLVDMGYLPAGWTAQRSSLNDGAYAVSFHRVPAGCVPVACDVEGLVIIDRPLREAGNGSPVDGVLVGPILTRAGADGGVSLATAPAVITGFSGTWSHPNPVPGQPAGVVAMRVGTNTGGFSQFVRIGDLRDPQLKGNLSAAGNLAVSGTSTLTGAATLEGPVEVRGALRLGAAAAPCVTFEPTGIVTVLCDGSLNARTGVFDDGTGARTVIGATGITSTQRIAADAGLHVGGSRLFDAADPSAIHVAAGEMFIRGPDGILASFQNGNVVAPGAVVAQRFAFTERVVEGGACGTAGGTQAEYGVTADQSLAACVNARWTVSSRFGAAGAVCPSAGVPATDVNDGQALLCRSGRYLRASALTSSFVLVNTLALQLSAGPVQVAKPACADSGSTTALPLIIVTPNNEDVPATASGVFSGVNRYAVDQGDTWLVVLSRAADAAPLGGNVVASIYCYFV